MNHHTGSCGIVDIFAECERREFRSLRNEAWVGVVKAVSRCKAIIKRRREGGRPHWGAQGAARRPLFVFAFGRWRRGLRLPGDGRSHMTSNTARAGWEAQNVGQIKTVNY